MHVRCFVRLASTKAKMRSSKAKLWLRHAQRDMKKNLKFEVAKSPPSFVINDISDSYS
jgi:hypothetical protein